MSFSFPFPEAAEVEDRGINSNPQQAPIHVIFFHRDRLAVQSNRQNDAQEKKCQSECLAEIPFLRLLLDNFMFP